MEALKSGTKYALVNPRNHQVADNSTRAKSLTRSRSRPGRTGSPVCSSSTKTIADNQPECRGHGGDKSLRDRGYACLDRARFDFHCGACGALPERRDFSRHRSPSGCGGRHGIERHVARERDQAERGTRLGPLVAAWRTGVKPVWKIVTKSGSNSLRRADHKVLTTAGWVPVEDLVPSVHKLLIQSGEGKFPEHQKLPFKPSNIYIGENGKATVLDLPTEWSRELGSSWGGCRRRWLRSGDKNCRVGFTFANSDAPVFATLRPILNRWYGRNIRRGQLSNGLATVSYHSRSRRNFDETAQSVRASEPEGGAPCDVSAVPTI